MTKILVIGGTSKLANELKKLKNYENIKIFYSYKNFKKNNFHLNLNKINYTKVQKFLTNKKIDGVLFCAGITDYYQCKKNYNKAFKINCIQTPKLIKFFLSLKIYTCFISTNTIFEKKTAQNEKSFPNPKFEYSKMKRTTENKIINYSIKLKKQKYLSVLRLTKNVNEGTQPFKDWSRKLKKNIKIKAFTDLYFSPITFRESALISIKILKKKFNGIFHLSGKKDFNYFEFAKLLALRLKKNKKLVISTTSKKEKIKLLYNNKVTSIKMTYTKKKLNINPVSINKVLREFK